MEILQYFISASFITLAIVYTGKMAIGKIFDGLVKKYEGKLNTQLETLKAEYQTEIETLKANKKEMLEGIKAEHQKLLDKNRITYERLHRDRTDIIVEIYKKLARLEHKIEEFLNSAESKYVDMYPPSSIDCKLLELVNKRYIDSVVELSNDMIDDFCNYVNENKLFFTEDLAESLDDLNLRLNRIKNLKGIAEDEREVESDKLIEALELTYKKIKEIKEEIQKEFRSLLGVVQE